MSGVNKNAIRITVNSKGYRNSETFRFSFFVAASDFSRLTASIRAGNTFSLISPATTTATIS